MRILGLDLETTGLNFKSDHVTEVGWVLIDTKIKKPLLTFGAMLKVPEGIKLSAKITEITHITNTILDEFGEDPNTIYCQLLDVIDDHDVDYIVAHNGNTFDRPMLAANLERYGFKLPEIRWIDTRRDIVFTKECKNKKLVDLCIAHGFDNPFPHAALFDTMATVKLLQQYDIEEIARTSHAPSVVVHAEVSYHDRQLAKGMGFGWENANYQKFPKMWVKEIKQTELEKFKSACDFKVNVIKTNP